MKTLQEQIYLDIQNQDNDKETRNILKLIKGDVQKERSKEVPDNIVLNIIKSYISGAEEMLVYLDPSHDAEKYKNNEKLIDVLSVYVPKLVSDDVIKEYINRLDMSCFKNKMQAMKPIMKHFGATADGTSVKNILMGL